MNIKTLAGKLGLSVSTVSKAFNDSHEISAATKEKVLTLAAELNYTPNPYAGSLRNKKSYNIAVVLPEVSDSFFSQAINGIESVAQEKGYHVLVYLTHEKLYKEQRILDDFRSGRVDGVLMSVSSETTNTDHITRLQEKGIPLVFFDRVAREVPAVKVVTNDFESAHQATTKLLAGGNQRVAFVSLSDKLAIINDRLEGYKKALSDAGKPFDEQLLLHCSANEQQNMQALEALLTQAKRPDAILASAEKIATDIYGICNGLQLQLPRDLKLIAFSSLQIAALLQPSLSTIVQPAFEMGKTAVTALFNILDKKPSQTACFIIPSVLIERKSSATSVMASENC